MNMKIIASAMAALALAACGQKEDTPQTPAAQAEAALSKMKADGASDTSTALMERRIAELKEEASPSAAPSGPVYAFPNDVRGLEGATQCDLNDVKNSAYGTAFAKGDVAYFISGGDRVAIAVSPGTAESVTQQFCNAGEVSITVAPGQYKLSSGGETTMISGAPGETLGVSAASQNGGLVVQKF